MLTTYADALQAADDDSDITTTTIFEYFLPPSPYRAPDAIRDQLCLCTF